MRAADELIAERYRLVRQLAGGGMGTVWEGWDERLHRQVAIKQLHTQPGLTTEAVALANERALREARITARLHHPYAITVYDVVEHRGQPCLIMEYLNSTSLQVIIAARGSLPPREVARIGAQVAAALVTAHRAGIVHRDVKPGNVLIAEDGTAKLTDFGISHAVGDLALTSTGMVTGTPAFLAPEVARGQESDFASDVFSLGSTLYAAVEGLPPFGAEENPMGMLHKVASGQVIAPRRAGELAPLLARMLAVERARRPAMAEVATALEAFHRVGVLPPAFREVPTAALPRAATGTSVGTSVEEEIKSTVAMPAVAAVSPTAGPPITASGHSRATPPPAGRSRLSKPVVAVLIVAALLLVGGLTVGVLLLSNGSGSGGTTPSTSPSSSPLATASSKDSSASDTTSSGVPTSSNPIAPTSTAASTLSSAAPRTTAQSTAAPSSAAPSSAAPSSAAPSSAAPSSGPPPSSAGPSSPASGSTAGVPPSTAVGGLTPPAAPPPPSVPVP